MITIHNGPLFRKCVVKAIEEGTADKLLQRISYLASFGNDEDEMLCDLHPRGDGDFDFLLSKNIGTGQDFIWQRYMNGGLVYHKYDNSWGVHT